MLEFARFRRNNGTEVSLPATYEQAFGMTRVNKPATDRFGRPLPPKPRVSRARDTADSAEAPAEAPARKGNTSKEKN